MRTTAARQDSWEGVRAHTDSTSTEAVSDSNEDPLWLGGGGRRGGGLPLPLPHHPRDAELLYYAPIDWSSSSFFSSCLAPVALEYDDWRAGLRLDLLEGRSSRMLLICGPIRSERPHGGGQFEQVASC